MISRRPLDHYKHVQDTKPVAKRPSHAMKEIMSPEETEAVLLVDANNAFNTINRQAALQNIGVICPAISTVLNNTYQIPVTLFVTGGEEIESSEGITQEIPLGW